MPLLPNSLALTTIQDASVVIASDHRNNYAQIQSAVNGLIAWAPGHTLADTFGNRPAANTVSPGVLFFATDTLGVWRSDGAAWTLVAQDAPTLTWAQFAAAPFATPYDGQMVRVFADAAQSTVAWTFRYRAVAAANKWEYIGGQPHTVAIVATETSTATATWINVATVGPSFPAPRSGVYQVWATAQMMNTAADYNMNLGIGIGDWLSASAVAAGSVPAASANLNLAVPQTAVSFTAGQEIRVKYYKGAAGTLTVYGRNLYIEPRAIT